MINALKVGLSLTGMENMIELATRIVNVYLLFIFSSLYYEGFAQHVIFGNLHAVLVI